MTALEMMTDTWWLAYGDEVNAGVAGDACAQLHAAVGKAEIALLVSQHRMVAS